MNQNDPNIGRRASHPMAKKDNYTGWIVGGAVAIAVILGLFAIYDRSGTRTVAVSKPATTTGIVTPPPAPPASPPAR
jgi:hypothetical protein